MLQILLLACALGDGGTVTGTVTTAVRERLRPVPGLSNDPACACLHEGKPKLDDLLVSEAGGVKNAFVWVSAGLPKAEHPVPTEPVVLDQKGCLYAPRVVAVRTGQPLEFRSQDDMLHNVHGVPFDNAGFNFGIFKGQSVQKKFAKPEIFKVKCDVHPWMGAVVGVFDHPYVAITDADGRFTIPNLPPGTYTLSVSHERLVRPEGSKPITAVVGGAATSVPAIDLVARP